MDAGDGSSVKDRLNDWANVALQRLGYSPQRSRDAKREAWWWLSARAGAVRRHGLFGGSAVVWTHPGRCELLDIEEAAPGPGEVTVEVASSIVSPGTERALYAGTGAPVQYPYRPGYSMAGVVVAAGRRAALGVGDRVAAAATHSSVVTRPAESVYPVPDGVPLEDAAFVQLGVIARQGIGVAGIRPGDSVCVLGSGVIGSLALRLAVAAGAGSVTAVARTRRRERLAAAGGATSYRALAEGSGLEDVGAAVVIDATGDPSAVADAVAAARAGGRVVLLGSPRGVSESLPVDEIRRKRLTFVGAHVSTLGRGARTPGDAFRHEALAFLAQLAAGDVAVADLVDVELDPREAPAFYRRLPAAADVTAARLDWTRLDESRRARRSRVLRPPDLTARGIDFGGRPLSSGRRRSATLPEGPLADAVGMLRIGLVGCGDIGVENADAIVAAPNTELTVCFDQDFGLADDVARRHGATAARTLEELLERADVDAVFLCVPHDLHTPLGVAVAQSGRHVIVEKPLAHTLASAVGLASAVDRAGVVGTVCLPHRYQAGVLAARRLVAEGALGELRGTLTTLLVDKPPSYWTGGYSGRASSDWRSSRARAGGGILIMNLSHFVDLALHIGGVPVETVTATLAEDPAARDVEESVSVSIHYRNGAVGTLFGAAAVPGTWEGRTSTELRLWGTDGHVAVEGRHEVFSVRGTTGLRAGRWHTLDGAPGVPLRTAFVSRFASAVSRGVPPDVGLEDALAVQAFVEAAYASAERGQAVRPAELLDAARAEGGRPHRGRVARASTRHASA